MLKRTSSLRSNLGHTAFGLRFEMSSAVKATLVASIVLAANGFEATSANWEEQNKDRVAATGLRPDNAINTSQSLENKTNSYFAFVSIDMIPDGSFWHRGSNHIGSEFPGKFCISCKLV